MNQATKPFFNRIAIVFDFDETLVKDTFDVLLKDCNLDVESFRKQQVQPLIDQGWDKVLARAYCLIQESKKREDKDKITQGRLARIGRELKPFEGVPEMFEKLQKLAHQLVPEVEVEFYLITGGFLEVALNTEIAKYFKAMWGCRFHYNSDGEIEFIKQQMTHTEKTHYLFYLSQGIDKEDEKDLIFNYRSVSPEKLHVPLNQTIYVGDGTSDIPCFSILNEYQGIAIGIYKPESSAQEWEHLSKIASNQRVTNLAPADYREDSELMSSLILAVENICKQISLSQLAQGE